MHFAKEKDFYSLMPDGHHATGDIWKGLPTAGLLRPKCSSGLIISPACDLANHKTTTVSYIPIIPWREFLYQKEFLLEVERQLKQLADQYLINYNEVVITEKTEDVCSLAKRPIQSDQAGRIYCCVKYLRMAEANEYHEDLSTLLNLILGKKWSEIQEKLVSNSYRSDCYFLPPDYEDDDWSALPTGGIVLLRYILTVSIESLDEVMRADERDWSSRRQVVIDKGMTSFSACPDGQPPFRVLRLKEPFLGDLLTKLVGLFVRLGAPELDPSIKKKLLDSL